MSVENHVLSVARMLRFFVVDRKFGYIDQLRNARDQNEFKKYLNQALREARARQLAGGEEYPPHIPDEAEIKRLIEDIQNEKKFKEIQLNLSLISLSFPVKIKGGEE